VPVLVIHGSADLNLPIEGGVGAKALAAHEVRSLASAVDFWRRHDGCGENAQSEVDGAVRRTRYLSCSGSSEVDVLTIEGGGHSWPGGDRLARFLDPPSPSLDATAEVWRFFARH
jgi:polyhydroxybutyrate depolymerase